MDIKRLNLLFIDDIEHFFDKEELLGLFLSQLIFQLGWLLADIFGIVSI